MDHSGLEVTIAGDALHKACKWPGYASSSAHQMYGQGAGEAVKSDCIWLDPTARNDPDTKAVFPMAMTFHLPSFLGPASAQAYSGDIDMLCKVPPLAWPWINMEGSLGNDRFPIFSPPLSKSPIPVIGKHQTAV
jgi:hypothetical protein